MDIPLIHLNMFGFSLFIRKPLIRFDRFDLDTYPLDLTSNGIRWHSYPLSVKSVFKLLYLSIFLVFALLIFFSKQQISSSKYIFLYSLFKIKKVPTPLGGGSSPLWTISQISPLFTLESFPKKLVRIYTIFG